MTPGDLVTTTHYDAAGNRTGFTVHQADDVISVTTEYLAATGLPVEHGCVTFDALNGSFRYRFAGMQDSRTLLFERVGT
jgi:hypothetical protein